MSERRDPKETDQINTEYAFQILRKAMQDHPEVEQSLWAGACWSCLVNGYINSGIPYKEFQQEMKSVAAFYKKRWEE